ncbi:MAG: hypothetical protein MI919_02970 [Holophagales bacterium]|nr:hypothetical protein [Holophagales bacterium]
MRSSSPPILRPTRRFHAPGQSLLRAALLTPTLLILALAVQAQTPPKEEASATEGAAAAEKPAPDPRVREALEKLELVYEVDTDGDYRLVFEVDDERTQLVYVISTTEEYRNLEVREVWSFGYEAKGGNIPAPVANLLLEDTFDKKLGAWAKVGERAAFITRVPAEADPDTLYSTLLITLEVAEEMERRLTPDLDEF